MEQRFKPGEYVKLITGNQKMQVVEYFTDIIGPLNANYKKIGDALSISYERVNDILPKETSLVVCKWYDRNNKEKTEKFEENLLEKVS